MSAFKQYQAKPFFMSKHMSFIQKTICIPQRWVFAIMGFFALCNAYTLRVCLFIAITKMAKPLNQSKLSIDETCPPYDDNAVSNVTKTIVSSSERIFEWNEYTQGIILSSFYWGYVITHIPGGLLSEKFGAKYILGFGILFTSIFCVLTPPLTFWGGANTLIIIRFLMGLGEGVIHPAITCLLSQWIPPSERTFISSFVFMGVRFGIPVSGVISGQIIRRSGDNWPSVFYLFGAVGILWFVFWMLLCHDSPKQHPFITDEEKDYLHEQMSAHVHEESPPFPWTQALTSRAFLAVVIAQLGQDWNSYTVVTDLPKYMQNVLKLPVHVNGYASTMHNLTALIFCMILSWISDWLIARNCMSRTNVRKINTAFSGIGPPTFLLIAMYVGCDVFWVISLITVGMTLFGAQTCGLKVNSLDLSPNYSGTLIGISNGAGALMGVFAPYVVGVLAPNQTAKEWQMVFWISAVISWLATANYLIFADGEVQEWNDPRTLRKKEGDVDESEGMDLLSSGKMRLRKS